MSYELSYELSPPDPGRRTRTAVLEYGGARSGGNCTPSLPVQLSGPVPHSRVLRLEISAGNLCSQLLTIEVFLGFPQWWSVGGREPVLG